MYFNFNRSLRVFECLQNDCTATFDTVEKMRHHQLHVHENDFYEKNVFIYRNHKHITVSRKNLSFQCKKCEYQSKKFEDVRAHCQQEHKAKMSCAHFTCQNCGKHVKSSLSHFIRCEKYPNKVLKSSIPAFGRALYDAYKLRYDGLVKNVGSKYQCLFCDYTLQDQGKLKRNHIGGTVKYHVANINTTTKKAHYCKHFAKYMEKKYSKEWSNHNAFMQWGLQKQLSEEKEKANTRGTSKRSIEKLKER